MADTRAEQIRRISQEALQEEESRREMYVSDACGDDHELRSEVLRLLEGEATDQTRVDDDSKITAPIPRQIGRYRIRRLLGSGGMGTVYEALQDKPRRKVAVKVMRSGVTSSKAARRFEYESQILGRLSHTGIAQVYEAGTYDDGSGGVPYFAMEYIPGAKTILEFVHERDCARREILELFCDVCDAVHHGHTKGIIHRDLKPGNILVDREGHSRIIDFGVARATDSDMAVTTLQTDVGQLLGTVQYMSPEQCEADPDILDTRSDVYALGIILYELLTGQLPYNLKTVPLFEAASIIREGTPSKLSTIDRGLRGDLETIVAKAIEKDRDRRYQSALELKHDIERFLRGDPIEARPPSIAYQLQLLARRNRGLVATIIIIILVMIVATIWSWMERSRAIDAEALTATALVDAESAREDAELEAARAEKVAGFLKHVVSMASPKVAQGETLSMNEILDRTVADIDEQFGEFPLVEAQVRTTFGEIYLLQGRLPEAEQNLREAITLRESHQESSEARLLQSKLFLLEVLIMSDRLKEADRMSETLLSNANETLGEEHLVSLYAIELRMQLLEKLSRYDEAAPLATQVATGYERILGIENERTYRARLSVLGTRLIRLVTNPANPPENDNLEQLKLDTIELRSGAETVLGTRHPVTLQVILTVGFLEFILQDLESARDTLEGVLEDSRLVLGSDHPKFLEALAAIGQINIMMGGADQAKAYLEESLAGYERTTGLATASAQAAASALANVYLSMAEYDQAIELAGYAMRELERILGEQHFQVMQARAVYTAGLALAGRINEDRPLMEETVQHLKEVLGEGDQRHLNMLFIYATGLMKTGEPSDGIEGLAMLKEVHEIASKSMGPEHTFTVRVLAGGITDAVDGHHRDGLMDIVRLQHAVAMQNPGPSNAWLLVTGRGLDFLAAGPGDDEALEPLIMALRAKLQETDLADSGYALKMARGHVLVLGRLGRIDEAREIALSTVSEAEETLGSDHKVTIQLQEWLRENP
ncbi:MAG: protein kinase [Planctomycetota bacterium]|nr:protein kinase [Planctomycetota bacterium]